MPAKKHKTAYWPKNRFELGFILPLWKTCYEGSGNPLFAWLAFRACHELKQAIPAWVLSCFHDASKRLVDLTNDPPTVVAEPVAEAMRMKRPGKSGQWNVFGEFDRMRRDFDLAFQVDRMVTRGASEAHAIRKIAENYQYQKGGLSEATVRRAWKRYKEFFDE